MRVFIYDHSGFIVTGFTAVVARDEEEALKLVSDALIKEGLKPDIDNVKELDLSKPGAHILFDGAY
jgi:hypothetical protein